MASPKVIEPTRAELAEANRRGEAAAESPVAIVHAEFNASRDAFRVQFRNGTAVEIPRSEVGVAAISEADPEQLREVRIPPMGNFVWFPRIDEGFSVNAAIQRVLGPVFASSMGQIGGRRKTPAKAEAVRANGAKGGRPKKKLVHA